MFIYSISPAGVSTFRQSFGKTIAAGATEGIQVKTIINGLPDVEAAMLLEAQMGNKAYKDLQSILISQIQQEYAKTPKYRASR